jgi:hypothetical protein
MRCVFHRLIPFVLTLSIGIMAHGLLGQFLFRSSPEQRLAVRSWKYSEPVKVVSVPQVDFPNSVKQLGATWTRLTFEALFDSDGKVKQIRPVYGGAPIDTPGLSIDRDQSAGAKATDSWQTKQHHIIDERVRDMSQLAMDQLSRTEFKPRQENGQPVAEWVTVMTTFAYRSLRGPKKGYSIEVKMSGDHISWQGETWTGVLDIESVLSN